MAFARLFGGPAPVTLQCTAGKVALAPDRAKTYAQLFGAVDHDSDGRVGGAEGALFLRRSRLDDDVLREVRGSRSNSRTHASAPRPCPPSHRAAGVALGLWGQQQACPGRG